MALLKKLIKWTFESAGFDVSRRSTVSNPTHQLLRALDNFDINMVLDIGANSGQFASKLRAFGFKGTIVSFEPLADAYRALSRHASRDSKWLVHNRTAIGDCDGAVEINIAGNSVSSSVLPMEEAHSSAAANSAYIGSEKVPICRLDSIAMNYLSPTTCCLLKIDVQGFEWQVLDGAKETLKQVEGILCEMSLVQLYKDQRLWMDVIQRLEQEGFALWALQKGFTDPRDGRTLQMDGVFFKTNKTQKD